MSAFTLSLLNRDRSANGLQQGIYFVETLAVILCEYCRLLILCHLIALICHFNDEVTCTEVARIREKHLLCAKRNLNVTV